MLVWCDHSYNVWGQQVVRGSRDCAMYPEYHLIKTSPSITKVIPIALYQFSNQKCPEMGMEALDNSRPGSAVSLSTRTRSSSANSTPTSSVVVVVVVVKTVTSSTPSGPKSGCRMRRQQSNSSPKTQIYPCRNVNCTGSTDLSTSRRRGSRTECRSRWTRNLG